MKLSKYFEHSVKIKQLLGIKTWMFKKSGKKQRLYTSLEKG